MILGNLLLKFAHQNIIEFRNVYFRRYLIVQLITELLIVPQF